MRRFLPLVVALMLAVPALSGCARNVKVQSGTRYTCTYGEALGSDVKTLEVPEKDASKYHVTAKTITCSKHLQAEALYLKAQQAIRSGDLKTAQQKLAGVLSLDAEFKNASVQLDALKKGKKPTPDSSGKPSNETTGSGGQQPDSGSSNQAMDAYRDLVPDALNGFTAEPILAESLTLTRSYASKDKSRYDQLVIMVEQRQTPALAERMRDTEIKPAYPSDGKYVTVSGLKGYFGTSAQNFAILSLVNGNTLVSFELHGTGTKAASLRGDLERIAEQVLD